VDLVRTNRQVRSYCRGGLVIQTFNGAFVGSEKYFDIALFQNRIHSNDE